MAQSQDRKAAKRHPLLVYQRIGNRMRTAPFMLAGISLILYGLGWLSTQDFMSKADTSLLQLLWTNQIYLIIIIFVCAAVFIYGLIVGGMSYVEARPKSLRIQAGLFAINISYARIRQIRLSQVSTIYPDGTVRGSDADLIDPLLDMSCSLIDMGSWPPPGHNTLRRLWSRFLFSPEGDSLMLVVPDAMAFNQQIDSRMGVRSRQAQQGQYLDPLERAIQAQKKVRHR